MEAILVKVEQRKDEHGTALDEPVYVADGPEGIQRLTPMAVASKIVRHLCDAAAEPLDARPKQVVITFPAYFSEFPRHATRAAADAAGLEVLKDINTPTVAAIMYNHGQGSADATAETPHIILAYDFGGGTFDASVVSASHQAVRVLSTGGCLHVGGETIDRMLMDPVHGTFADTHKAALGGVDLQQDKEVMALGHEACVHAKETLSSLESLRLRRRKLWQHLDLSKTLSRVEFEILVGDMVEETMVNVLSTLAAERLEHPPDAVVLVGGSSRIPPVRPRLTAAFPEAQIVHSVDPDIGVASSAAIRAHDLVNNDTPSVSLIDMSPRSLGNEMADPTKRTVLPRNTQLNTTHTTRAVNVEGCNAILKVLE